MIDFGDGSDNLRVDGSAASADLDFWLSGLRLSAPKLGGQDPSDANRPTIGQMIGTRETPVAPDPEQTPAVASAPVRTSQAPAARIFNPQVAQQSMFAPRSAPLAPVRTPNAPSMKISPMPVTTDADAAGVVLAESWPAAGLNDTAHGEDLGWDTRGPTAASSSGWFEQPQPHGPCEETGAVRNAD